MAVDIERFKNEYFIFDKPVSYKLKCGVSIEILPVKLLNSMVFLSSYGILDIDKNSSNDVDIIQMSYLKFLLTKILITPETKQQMANICLLCLGFKIPYIILDEKGRAVLVNLDETGEILLSITAREFDDIKKIILYQNIPDYDDAYISPDMKEAMREYDELKNKGYTMPSLERKIGIITAHCGITKTDQKEMTLREHTLLFKEVCGEVEYSAVKGISCFGGKADDIQWIYQKAKGKFDDYITSVESYNRSMGGDGSVKVIHTNNNNDNFIGG